MTQDEKAQNKKPLSEKPQSKRKLAKTLLELDQRSFVQEKLTEGPKGTESSSSPRVARTLLDVSMPSFNATLRQEKIVSVAQSEGKEPDLETDAKPGTAEVLIEADVLGLDRRQVEQTEIDGRELLAELVTSAQPKDGERVQRFVAKTLLDSDVLANALQKFQVRKVELAAEEAKIRASQPGVEFHPVDSKKLAQRCAWRWDDDSTERFRSCQTCKSHVYNFAGLELAQAEALILIRENKQGTTLYKRADGKFMTQDCPVQVKRKRTVVFLSIVAVTMLIVLVATLILMPPKLPFARTMGGAPFEAAEMGAARDMPMATSAKNAPADVQSVTRHTGTRKRPTFTPEDKSLYWE
ncbi:MAG TPA: hypothetical protein V6C97_08750 [Oculatellaceae cyanobacterium]